TAAKVRAAAMGSFADVSAAAHVPGSVAGDVAEIAAAGTAITALRLEGVAPSVAQRKAVLEKLLRPFGALAVLEDAASRSIWRSIRDVTPFTTGTSRGGHDIWRISTAPTRGADIGRALADKSGGDVLYDWAGGLVWAALPRSDDAHADLVHPIVAQSGGHPPLIRAPPPVR